MVDIEVALRACLYIALIVLVIVFIVLGIKLIKTISKVDKTLEVIDDKLTKTDGVFNVFEKTGSFVDEISDKVIILITNLIGKFINKRKGNDLDE